MKFIKEWKLFESKDRNYHDDLEIIVSTTRDRINAIFSGTEFKIYIAGNYSKINSDVILIRITIFKHSSNNNRFTRNDIRDELFEISKIGFDYKYSAVFIENTGYTTVRNFDSLIFGKYNTYNMNNLDIKFCIMNEDIMCSNPECDNIILNNSISSCPVCGEERENFRILKKRSLPFA